MGGAKGYVKYRNRKFRNKTSNSDYEDFDDDVFEYWDNIRYRFEIIIESEKGVLEILRDLDGIL